MRAALILIMTYAIAAVSGAGVSQAAEGISIDKGNARIVRLVEPAETVIIGEPEVADVAVKDAMTLVLTGKTYGTTNLVVFNGAGEPIVDQPIIVSRQGKGSVRLYRRAEVELMTCMPVCEKDRIGGEGAGSGNTGDSDG